MSIATAQRVAPHWVSFGPDTEGNYDGPSGRVGAVCVSSSWSPRDGAVMWVDAVGMPDLGALTPEFARQRAALLRAEGTFAAIAQAAVLVWVADIIDPPATPTNSVASGGSDPRRGGHHPSRPVPRVDAGREATNQAVAEVAS